ncbi:MAG: SCO family protein [Planctomycetota bacterium]
MNKKRIFIWVTLILVLGAVTLHGLFRMAETLAKSSKMPLAELATVPGFRLIERSGREVTRGELEGRIWVADFIFTHCAGTCPVMNRSMQGLATLFERCEDLRLVSITCDPKRDTPEVLRSYAEGLGADAERWLFLTGDAEAIQSLAQDGFKLAASAGESIVHSQRLVLVDRKLRIRGYYDGTVEAEVGRLERDLLGLIEALGEH